MKRVFILFILFISTMLIYANGYKTPHSDIVDIVTAPDTPVISWSVRAERYAEVHYKSIPDLSDLMVDVVKLAGVRINGNNFSEYKTLFYTHFDFFHHDGRKINIKGMPQNLKIIDYDWSWTGRYFGFTVAMPDSVDLYIVDFEKENCKKVTTNISNVFTKGFYFLPDDNDEIIVMYNTNSHKPVPQKSSDFVVPIIDETGESASQVRTYQDLLQDKFDEILFKYYFTSVITRLNIHNGRKTFVTKPGI
ncbi:MAG: hypothetical protein WC337_07000, partial [Candidatus Muiribacteriota bacterium]